MPSAAVSAVLAKLHGSTGSGPSWKAKCPAHEDLIASLSISEGAGGKALLRCHAGCSFAAILDALHLTVADVAGSNGHTKTEPVTYDYQDAEGHLVYQVCRFPPKDFRQRRPDGARGWIWRMAGVTRVPYRLPKLQAVDLVMVVEGEKDADRLWAANIPATTNAGGAGKWGPSETAALKTAGVRRVVILPDNDPPGVKHGETVASHVRKAGLAASILMLPDLPAHGDVSDWFDSGHTPADLLTLVNAAPYVVPSNGKRASAATSAVLHPPSTPTPPGVFNPLAYHFTELGAAQSFRDRYAEQVRFDQLQGSWLIWDGHYWRPDADEAVRRLAHGHALYWQQAAMESVADYDLRKAAVAFALKLEKRSTVDNFLTMARSMLPISTAGDLWDANGWLLGCANGIVDLTTGTLRPGAREDHVTQQTRIAFDASARCPRWERFVGEVFDGNQELVDYMHKALGYSLTADMREQCFFVAFGSGSNGKSVWLDTLETVWGSYGHRADMRIFAGHGEVSTFHLADFRGRRLIFAAETKPNSRMNEHVVKNFTGGETLRVEHKYGHPFTIKPVGKIWLGVNHRPVVKDDSFGFWRRVRLIPFLRTFTGSADDRTLKDTLKAESAGILAWAVRGCLRWQADGLTPPAIVVAETDQYQTGEDPLADFFTQRTVLELDSLVTFGNLYIAYRNWAVEQGIPDRDKLTAKGFGNLMVRRPFERLDRNNQRCYKGLRLVSTTLFPDRDS